MSPEAIAERKDIMARRHAWRITVVACAYRLAGAVGREIAREGHVTEESMNLHREVGRLLALSRHGNPLDTEDRP